MDKYKALGLNDSTDHDIIADRLIKQYDETAMPLPDIEFEPHVLISKVRKHYMEYIIQLLSVNYEKHQKLLNKNIYLPSAIWRCAKYLEMNAAQSCMMVQIYRNNMVTVIKELKNDTKKGKLNRRLYECLNKPPENEKKVQTVGTKECNCQCTCTLNKKRRKLSSSPKNMKSIPIIPSMVFNNYLQPNQQESFSKQSTPMLNESQSCIEALGPKITNIASQTGNVSPKTDLKMNVESQDSDELMLQLEKLFQGDGNDDDIFDTALCDTTDTSIFNGTINKINDNSISTNPPQDSVIEDHAAQIKSLDERLASLAGMLVTQNETVPQKSSTDIHRQKKHSSSKWLCEEYFLKVKLFEILDQIRDTNRKKFVRVKDILLDLFGEDSDDDNVMSPLEETTEFVISCKERIAPWVVKLLTPYYIKGRIRGKALFKSLAKHLIRLIYQCSKYPDEYEVNNFVYDFLENHKMIRCEADFMQFRIENI